MTNTPNNSIRFILPESEDDIVDSLDQIPPSALPAPPPDPPSLPLPTQLLPIPPKPKHQQDQSSLKKKHALILSVDKTRSKILALDREIPSLISKASCRNEITPILTCIKTDSDKLVLEEQTLATHIYKIKSTITSLLDFLKRADVGSTNMRMIRQTMESVEQDISTFRDVTREKMDSLLLDETHLTKELLTITDRIESSFHATIDESDEPLAQDAAKAAEESSIPKQPPTQQDTESGLKEVKAFQRYLHRHGGYYGGWDDLSHTAYLTLRQKYGANNPKLVHACVSSIPGIGYPEAHAHEQWYRQFRELLEAKKEAIRVWRERKAAAAAKAEDEMRESQEVQRDISVVKMELEMEARERMKENLAVWKGKQEKLMHERKRMEKEERERREAEKERWRERNALLKEKVTQHAQEKAQQEAIQRQLMEEARLMEQSANEKAARQEMERLKQRDAELIELKKKRLAEKERAEKEREERLTKIRSLVSVEGVVDPTRVLQPTKNQLYRASATKEPTSFVALNQLPRRSVPTWRKGL